MNWIQKGIIELRDVFTIGNVPSAFVSGMFGDSGGPTDAGVSITPQNAIQSTGVWACVRVLSEAVASLPLNIYEITPQGRKVSGDHPLAYLLGTEPNPEMNSFNWRESQQVCLSLYGNSYNQLQFDGIGRLVGIWPLDPRLTSPFRDPKTGDIVYRTQGADGAEKILASSEVLHLKGLSMDGLVGLSPIEQLRQSLGLSRAMEKYGAQFFGNGTRPGGILSHPKVLTKEAANKVRESWQAAHGTNRAHGVAVLEEGMTWTPISIPPEHAQFIQSRQFQLGEIARIFRVQPHLIGDLERATNNNIEHQGLEFVTYTLRPILERWEAEINRKLFRRNGRNAGRFYAEFDVRAMLRGDFKTTQEAYAVGRNGGWLSVNDIREREGDNPIEGGDVYLQPLNYVPVATDDTDAGSEDEPGQVQLNSLPVLKDAVRRYLKRDKKDAENFGTVFSPVLEMLGAEAQINEMYARSTFWSGDEASIAEKEMACLQN